MPGLSDVATNMLLDTCISPEGWFYASGSQNVGQGNYNCLFGRDACITSLLLMAAIKTAGLGRIFLPTIRRTLEKLADTAGRRFDRLTGEKPGWILHLLRTDEYIRKHDSDLPIGDDGALRIYQSLDATPLYCIAIYQFAKMSGDEAWLASQMFAIKNALKAILQYGDNNGDGLFDYTVPVERTCPGLIVQNWMDSCEGWPEPFIFPIAPVEIQGYVWLAFRYWSEFFREREQEPELRAKLDGCADALQASVWERFATEDASGLYLASNVNGAGRLTPGACSSMGHLLWATDASEGVLGSLDQNADRYSLLAQRLMSPDMFDPEAGIRTFAATAPQFNPKRYHHGAQWPHDNALICLGMAACGFSENARCIAQAVFRALEHFGSPGMELYCHTKDGYGEYRHSGGNTGNRDQAWALAGTVAMAATMESIYS